LPGVFCDISLRNVYPFDQGSLIDPTQEPGGGVLSQGQHLDTCWSLEQSSVLAAGFLSKRRAHQDFAELIRRDSVPLHS
jgi:hypothetical protein